MNINGNKIIIAVGILGLLASVYMIVADVFYNKDFSIIAIVAGLVTPIYLLLFNKGKSK